MSIAGPDDPILVAAARHGLGDAEPIAMDPADAERILAAARFDHVTGLLAAAVTEGQVVVAEDVRATLLQRWHEELLVCVVLEALAVRTGSVLDEAGVRWRLTKGAALAHLDYPDPSVRTFGDVDVVVHPEDWDRALRTLQEDGYNRETPPLPAGYDRRFGKGATLTTPDQLEIDLHRRFAIGRFGVSSRMEDVFEPHETIVLAARELPVMAGEHRLLHACYHASLGGFSGLRAFRDVAQLILVSAVDWERTFEIASAWRAQAVLSSAIVGTWRRLGLDEGHPALERSERARISRSDRRALRVFREERPFAVQALTAFGRLPLHEMPTYAWSLAAHRFGWDRPSVE